ncbi:MAG: hypothetical protein VKP62_02145, partial [Candidatus Sericytochromatia bacterium]|nr:hypothetical protein [Candidatus Sericytochromatia bacterium]
MRRRFIPHSLVLALCVAVTACQGGPSPNTATAGQSAPTAKAGAGEGVIKGVVKVDEISAGAYRLAQTAAKGGTVTARSDIDTKEATVGPDGSFSVVVKGGAEYKLEASVPDGKGGVTKVVSPTAIMVPLAQDPPIVDAASLVTRRTGSIQGLIELKDAKAGDTPEGADVFLTGGT